jgi:hypothetical protein
MSTRVSDILTGDRTVDGVDLSSEGWALDSAIGPFAWLAAG